MARYDLQKAKTFYVELLEFKVSSDSEGMFQLCAPVIQNWVWNYPADHDVFRP